MRGRFSRARPSLTVIIGTPTDVVNTVACSSNDPFNLSAMLNSKYVDDVDGRRLELGQQLQVDLVLDAPAATAPSTSWYTSVCFCSVDDFVAEPSPNSDGSIP